MGGDLVTQHRIIPEKENISGTINEFPPDVTRQDHGGDPCRETRPGRFVRPCSYVVATKWRYGGPDPFCNAPALPGSSYCPRHHALCEPQDAGAAALAVVPDAAAPPPAEFAHLAATPLPEPPDEDEPADDLGVFPLPRRGARTEE